MAELELENLDKLLWIHVRLLFTVQALQRFLSMTPESELQRDLAEIEGKLLDLSAQSNEGPSRQKTPNPFFGSSERSPSRRSTRSSSKVQEQLGDQPGTLKLKQQMLETVLANLEKIAAAAERSSDGSSPGDRSAIVAHRRLGDAFRMLLRPDLARRQNDEMLELGRQHLGADPGNLVLLDSVSRCSAILDFCTRAFR